MIKFSLLEFKDLRSFVVCEIRSCEELKTLDTERVVGIFFFLTPLQHRVIASAQTTAEALRNASVLNLPLVVESKSLNRTSAPEYLLLVQILNQCSNALDFNHVGVL